MEGLIILSVWAATSALSFWLMVRWWRADLAVTRRDALAFAVTSAIPIVGILVATCLNVGDWLSRRFDGDAILWPRS